MSFDLLDIQLDKLNYRLQKWQMTKVYLVKRNLEIRTPQKTSNWEFSFELHLEHLGIHQSHHHIKVSRKSFKVNGKAPDYLISRITNELQESLYPIVFSCDVFGRLMDVVNFAEIKQNWNQKKQEMQKVHEGHGMDAVIQQMESYLTDKVSFLERIRYDTSILGLFLPVYRKYGIENKIKEEVFEVYIPGIDKLTFKGNLQYQNSNASHQSDFKGKLIQDEITIQNLENYIQESSGLPLTGQLTYLRQTQSHPFSRQSIDFELNMGEISFYKESIDYQFLRILN